MKRDFSWPNDPGPFTIPILPEVPVLRMSPKGPVYDSRAITERLRVIIQSHPHKEIREDLNRLIESGEIALSWQIQGSVLANFRVLTPEAIEWSEKPTRDRQPAFVIRPSWLATLTQEQVTDAWLVFFHEYQHYLQWKRGDAFIAFTSMNTLDQKLQLSDCVDAYWQTELEAYEAECLLAKEWNVHFFVDLCPYVEDPEEFKQALFIRMADQLAKSSVEQMCIPEIARAAGHPNPEAWKL